MIRSKDLNKEIKALEVKLLKAEKKPDEVGNREILKAMVLMLKVVRDVKTNQVTALVKGLGIGEEGLIKPKFPPKDGKRPEEKKTKE